MPRTVIQPATKQAAPATSNTTPAAQVPSDPYEALASQLRALGLSEEGVAAAVAQKKAADTKAAPAPAPKPVVQEKPVAEQAPTSEADVNRAMVAAIVADNKKKAAPAPTAPAETVETENNFASQVPEEEEGDPIFGVVASEEPHAETAVVPVAETAPAQIIRNQWTDASGGAISGEVDQTDFQMPQLKIVQGNSEATANHNHGELVFTDIKIFDGPTQDKPTPVMRFVPISVSKYWREEPPKSKLPSKVKPRNVQTKAEVARLGGTTEWTVGRNGERVKPTWSPAARVLLLIEQPEGNDHPGFTIPIEDGQGNVKYWAAAVYFVNGGAYRSFAKPIIDATTFILREGDKISLSKRIWKMQVVKEKSGEYMVFNPKVGILNVMTPDSLRQMAANLVSNG